MINSHKANIMNVAPHSSPALLSPKQKVDVPNLTITGRSNSDSPQLPTKTPLHKRSKSENTLRPPGDHDWAALRENNKRVSLRVVVGGERRRKRTLSRAAPPVPADK